MKLFYNAPTSMAPYTRQEEIGHGSWGVVYKAVDRITGDIVAVKELADQAGIPKREVSLGRKITHRNVCRIYECFEEDNGSRCIAMEFCAGGNLQDLMRQSGPLSVDQCLSIAHEILNGIEAAHLQNIVHRDLKPANILLSAEGTPKVSDFGHARLFDAKASPESELVQGTLAYMAPEQLRGRECDGRADIFSFGVVLHELLSGTRPDSPASVQLPSTVPAYIKAVIQRCLHSDPSGRFASVSELRNALAGPRLMRPVRALTATLAFLLALTLSGGFLTWKYSAVVPNPAPAAPASRPPAVETKALPTVAVFVDGSIGDTLAEALVSDGRFQVVERAKLEKVLSEIRLNENTKVESATDQRAGQVAGAQYLMFGSARVSQGRIEIDARLVRTETSKVVAIESITGDAAQTKQLAAQLVARFRI